MGQTPMRGSSFYYKPCNLPMEVWKFYGGSSLTCLAFWESKPAKPLPSVQGIVNLIINLSDILSVDHLSQLVCISFCPIMASFIDFNCNLPQISTSSQYPARTTSDIQCPSLSQTAYLGFWNDNHLLLIKSHLSDILWLHFFGLRLETECSCI